MISRSFAIGAMAIWVLAAPASALTVPFTENYSADAQGWVAGNFGALAWNAAGGPDGSSYVSTVFNYQSNNTGDNPAVFRGQDEFAASGHAFEGNWVAGRVGTFSVYVRHDAGVPLTIFTRFASPVNFPGAAGVAFAPVPSGVWTQVTIPVHFGSPNLVTFEGTSYGAVFPNIGHLQIGATVPASLAHVNQDITFSLDQPMITANLVPAVSEWGIASLGLTVLVAGTLALRGNREATVRA